MIYEQWQATKELRYRLGILQQRWRRKTIEWRAYGGRERRCEGYESEWRDVPQATAAEIAELCTASTATPKP